MENTRHLIQFFAGPGSGKSTACARVYAYLKENNTNAEMHREIYKDLVWQKNAQIGQTTLGVTATANTAHQQLMLFDGGAEVVLTDGPVSLGSVYSPSPVFPAMTYLFEDELLARDVLVHNIFIERVKPYNPFGRTQTAENAMLLDTRMEDLSSVGLWGHHYRAKGDTNIITHLLELDLFSRIWNGE